MQNNTKARNFIEHGQFCSTVFHFFFTVSIGNTDYIQLISIDGEASSTIL